MSVSWAHCIIVIVGAGVGIHPASSCSWQWGVAKRMKGEREKTVSLSRICSEGGVVPLSSLPFCCCVVVLAVHHHVVIPPIHLHPASSCSQAWVLLGGCRGPVVVVSALNPTL
jgi:hypothetical protein